MTNTTRQWIAPDGSLPRPEHVYDGPGLVRIAVMSCATCQHYHQEEHGGSGYCADTREHPMQHQMCPPTWGCPMWEANP